MSDAAAPISPSINLKVRHGFLGLWAQPQEPAAATVLVMASLLVARTIVHCTLATVVTFHAMYYKPSAVGAIGAQKRNYCRSSRSIQVLCKTCVLSLAQYAENLGQNIIPALEAINIAWHLNAHEPFMHERF